MFIVFTLTFIRQKMTWTPAHDVLLCREILVEEPFKFKHGSRERGQHWDKIATSLNQMGKPRFLVDQRSVRDRFLKLERNFKGKMAEEERASGIEPPEPTELDQAIQDIIERSEEAQDEMAKGDERREKAAEKEKETAESVRKRSMERLAETRQRESPENGSRKRRINGDHDPMEYLKEKNEKELKLRLEEIEIKRREIELKEKEKEREWEMQKKDQEMKERECEARMLRDRDLMLLLQQQIQQQQAMQQQMQQQNQLLLDFMKKIMEKRF